MPAFKAPTVRRRTTKFTASLRDMGRESPYFSALPPVGYGYPTYLVLGTRQIITLNLWYWMLMRYLQTTSVVATGGKGGGKTAHIRYLIYLHLMLSQGGQRTRAIYDNMRNDFDAAEDQFMLDTMGDQAGRINAREGRFNPYHPALGLSPEQMLRWTLTTAYDMTQERFTGYQVSILSQALKRMSEQVGAYSCPSLLFQMLAEYDTDLYDDFVADDLKTLKVHLGPSADHVLSRVLRPATDSRETVFRYDQRKIRTDAAALADILHQVLLGGLSGNVFGNEGSFMDAIAGKRYVSQDLTGLDPALASSYHYFARMVTGQQKFDVIGQDETSVNWRYLTWALASSDEEWQIRGQNPIIIRSIQELSLLRTAGDEGAQQREMAEASVRGAGLHLIHPGQSVEAYRNLQEILGFSDLDLRWLQGLDPNKPGVLAIKARGQGRSLLRVQLDPVSAFETNLIKSNASLTRRLEGYYNHLLVLEETRAQNDQ